MLSVLVQTGRLQSVGNDCLLLQLELLTQLVDSVEEVKRPKLKVQLRIQLYCIVVWVQLLELLLEFLRLQQQFVVGPTVLLKNIPRLKNHMNEF